MARHPEGQGVPHITVDAYWPQDLLQHRSPVTRLPPEILNYVFQLYVARVGALTPDGGVAPQGPSRLTQVCTLWRAIAKSDPFLWTSIHFYFPESHAGREKDVPRVQPVLDRHLKQSDPLPISLILTDHRTDHLATNDLVSLLVDRLQTHARRWTRISLHLSRDYFPLLSTFTPCDLSSLEHLTISGDVLTRSSTVYLPLASATNLKSFTYTGSGPQERIHLHWESLEEVSFGFAPHCGKSCTFFHQLRYLAKCRNITTCSLGLDHRHEFGALNRPITLPCLQTLRVRLLFPGADATGAIDRLTVPRLQTLEIDAAHLVTRNRLWHDHNFSGLLARSRCTLLHLSIQDVEFPNDELVRCLALSPQLASLRFIPCPRSQDISDVIRAMDVSQSATGGQTTAADVANPVRLVTLLCEMTLASSVERYLDPMLRMFRSRVGPRARTAGVAALQRAEVIFFDMWHDRVRVPGDRLERVARFRADLTQWASESRDGKGKGNEDGDGVQVSVVVDSPYLPEYIDVES